MARKRAYGGMLLAALWLASACGDDSAGGEDGDGTAGGGNAAPAGDAGPAGAEPSAAGDAATAADGGPACGLAGCGRTLIPESGRVDLLFVVDDSGSMGEEQAALAQEFPRMMQKLTSGDHDEDGVAEYEPATDLHLGVVSTNLGISAQGVAGCEPGGDSGRLLARPTLAECDGGYPHFLTYEADTGDPAQTASDFACLAVLGTSGCGFEQPLESALMALWPSADPSIGFVAPDPDDQLGRGDRDNAGFLRNDPSEPPATLGLIVVTDEDDCSAHDPNLWTPTLYLAEDDPLRDQPLNLRCFFNPESLYPIERYLHGYRGLHGLTGARVLFAAIVGVPVDLVDQPALADVDWGNDAEREAHYQKILDDPRMEEVVDQSSGPPADELVPSCISEHGRAYPPRRIVELARRFGPNSLVQSICGDNLGPPIDLIVRNVVRAPD